MKTVDPKVNIEELKAGWMYIIEKLMDDTSSDRLMKTSFGRLRPKPLLTVAKRTQEQ